MPNYKILRGSLTRKNKSGKGFSTYRPGDVVEMTPDQARKYGLRELELTKEDLTEPTAQGAKRAGQGDVVEPVDGAGPADKAEEPKDAKPAEPLTAKPADATKPADAKDK